MTIWQHRSTVDILTADIWSYTKSLRLRFSNLIKVWHSGCVKSNFFDIFSHVNVVWKQRSMILAGSFQNSATAYNGFFWATTHTPSPAPIPPPPPSPPQIIMKASQKKKILIFTYFLLPNFMQKQEHCCIHSLHTIMSSESDFILLIIPLCENLSIKYMHERAMREDKLFLLLLVLFSSWPARLAHSTDSGQWVEI